MHTTVQGVMQLIFSLYYFMFGRKPHLPIDILFGTNRAELKGHTSTKYVENLNGTRVGV